MYVTTIAIWHDTSSRWYYLALDTHADTPTYTNGQTSEHGICFIKIAFITFSSLFV